MCNAAETDNCCKYLLVGAYSQTHELIGQLRWAWLIPFNKEFSLLDSEISLVLAINYYPYQNINPHAFKLNAFFTFTNEVGEKNIKHIWKRMCWHESRWVYLKSFKIENLISEQCGIYYTLIGIED